MLTESLAAALLTASVTGAGLVLAFYALIAHMSDKIFEKRFKALDKNEKKVDQIVRNRENFKPENLRKTTKILEELDQENASIKVFPRYLGAPVAISFLIFLSSAILNLDWLYSSSEVRANMNDSIIIWLFIVSIALFALAGGFGIVDVMLTMREGFEELKARRNEIKENINIAPMENDAAIQVGTVLESMGVGFERQPIIKTDGEALIPDFAIPSSRAPKYLIEVNLRLTAESIYTMSEKYEGIKWQGPVKTILVSDFSNHTPYLPIAKAYWDFVVDARNLDELKRIIED